MKQKVKPRKVYYCVPCRANREVDQLMVVTHDTPEGKAVVVEWRCARCGEVTEFRTFVDKHGDLVLRAYDIPF